MTEAIKSRSSMESERELLKVSGERSHFDHIGIPSIKVSLSDASFCVAEMTAVFLCNSANSDRFHARPKHQLALWLEFVIVNQAERPCTVPELRVEANHLVIDSSERNDTDTPAPRGLFRSCRGTNFDLYHPSWFSGSLDSLNLGYGRFSERLLPTDMTLMQEEWRREFSEKADCRHDSNVEFALCMDRAVGQTKKVLCYPASYTKSRVQNINGGVRVTIIPRLFSLDNLYPSCKRERLKVGAAFSLWYGIPLQDPPEFYLRNDLYNFVANLNFDCPILQEARLNLFVMAPARFKLENFTPTLRYYPSYGVIPTIWKSKNEEPLQSFCVVEGASGSYGLPLQNSQSILVNCHFKDEVSPRHIVNYRFGATVGWGVMSLLLSHLSRSDTVGTLVIAGFVWVVVFGSYWCVTGNPVSVFRSKVDVARKIWRSLRFECSRRLGH